MASTSNISNPKFLTENDIPGAFLFGRKPKELKISEIKFWRKCCGDAGISVKKKTELVNVLARLRYLVGTIRLSDENKYLNRVFSKNNFN